MRADSLGFFWRDEPAVAKVKLEKPKRTAPEPTWLKPDYLPGLQDVINFKPNLMTDEELISACNAGEPLVFDVESYANYFLVAFESVVTGKVFYFEMESGGSLECQKLRWVLENFTVIGFNSKNYDVPILALACAGKSVEDVKRATNMVIAEGLRPSDVLKQFKVKPLNRINHVDLIDVAPLKGSLKTYGARMHVEKLQDLPFHPEAILTRPQITITRVYCINDLCQTAMLYEALKTSAGFARLYE